MHKKHADFVLTSTSFGYIPVASTTRCECFQRLGIRSHSRIEGRSDKDMTKYFEDHSYQ